MVLWGEPLNFMKWKKVARVCAPHFSTYLTYTPSPLRSRSRIRPDKANVILTQLIHSPHWLISARFEWKPDDPEIVSDVLFAVANVMSIARTTYLMPAFEVLGPLQISLGRMLGDITRFLVLFTLVSPHFCYLYRQCINVQLISIVV